MLEIQMEHGIRKQPRPTLDELRTHTLENLQNLDARQKALRRPAEYPVRPTAALNAMLISEKLKAEHRQD